MTVLIDSWAWIEYLKSTSFGEKAREYIEGNEEKIISTMNIAEIYKYLLKASPERAAELIEYILNTSFAIFVDIEIALNAAKFKHEKKLGMADAIILATARQHNAKVITGDDDFKKESNVIYIGE